MPKTTRTLLLAVLASVSGLFAACSHDAPAPDLTPAYEMNSRFQFQIPVTTGGTSPGSRVIDFTPASIQGKALLAPNVLSLDFMSGRNNVHFEVDRSQLQSKWIGTYPMRCQARPTAPVGLSFVHSWAGDLSVFPFSATVPQLTGNLIITDYSAKNHVASDRYQITAPDQMPPPQIARPDNLRCDIILTGRFTNLAIVGQ